MKDQALSRYERTEKEAADAFAAARRTWLESDRKSWLATHGFYPEARRFVRHLLDDEGKRYEVCIITTKAKEFALELLEEAGLGDIAEEMVYGLGSGKKKDVLQREAESRQSCFFVEDRLAALDSVLAAAGVIPDVHLVLAGWGYNTHGDRDQAISGGKITVLRSAKDLFTLL